MISVTPESYAKIASHVLEAIRESDFFNGRIEYAHEEYDSILTCTLVIYRKEGRDDSSTRPIDRVVPVWWQFSTSIGGVEQDNDFGWSDLATYLY